MDEIAITTRPVAPAERIMALDALRGFALLGILVMNIQSFSMIEAAYFNPTSYGDLTGLNKAVWIVSHLFADQKFMTIFAVLFGAGIVLMARSAEAKGRKATGLHYRRTFWLLVIGLGHAYLLWYGDILVVYALCALSVFWFRKLSPFKLLFIGILMIAMGSLISLFLGWSLPQWPAESHEEIMAMWAPAPESIEHELAVYRGGWIQQIPHRAQSSFFFHTIAFLTWGYWRAGGLMLVGMALFKWGVLTAQRSLRFYRVLMFIGLGLGLATSTVGVICNFNAGWSLGYSMFMGTQYNYWGSLLVSAGYISAVMWFCKRTAQSSAVLLLANIGRTALSNYLLQTFICTTLFYGHGFGWYGHVSRWQQILVVLGVWAFQLTITPIWLRHFRFGPCEWVWRSLTYMKLQSLAIPTSS